MDYRDATAGDVEAIAALHADSWRRHYRGAYLDSYLGGDVFVDLRTVWTDRFTRPTPDRRTFYQAQGGSRVERELTGPFPGGGYAFSFRYAWPDLSSLAR